MIVVCLFCKISVLLLSSCFFFVAGMSNLLILLDACNATKFDLFGKTFFNYQGSASTFRPIMLFITILSVGIGAIPIFIFEGWVQFAILTILGLLGFALHRPIFKWEEKKFLSSFHVPRISPFIKCSYSRRRSFNSSFEMLYTSAIKPKNSSGV